MQGKYVTAVIIGISAAGLSLAALRPHLHPQPAAKEAPVARVAALQEARGRVLVVDGGRGRITLALAEGRKDFRYDTSTTVFVHGRTGDLRDLTIGQQICATFEAAGEEGVLQWVEVCR